MALNDQPAVAIAFATEEIGDMAPDSDISRLPFAVVHNHARARFVQLKEATGRNTCHIFAACRLSHS